MQAGSGGSDTGWYGRLMQAGRGGSDAGWYGRQ